MPPKWREYVCPSDNTVDRSAIRDHLGGTVSYNVKKIIFVKCRQPFDPNGSYGEGPSGAEAGHAPAVGVRDPGRVFPTFGLK